MLVKQEFLKRLRSTFNLNIYEVKIWTALLSKGVASAGELSEISDVPRSRSYDILESLEKKGFIVMKLGKPIKYIAVKPEEIIRRVKNHIQREANTQVEMIDKAEGTDFFAELSLLFKNGIEHIDPATLSGSLRGRNSIYDHMLSMVQNAQKNVSIATSADGLARKSEFLPDVLRKLSNKGVKVRIAAPLDKDNKDQKGVLNKISKHADVRELKDLNARFVVVDSKDILFMVNDDKNIHESSDVGIWVTSPFFASTLESLFKLNWNKAK